MIIRFTILICQEMPSQPDAYNYLTSRTSKRNHYHIPYLTACTNNSFTKHKWFLCWMTCIFFEIRNAIQRNQSAVYASDNVPSDNVILCYFFRKPYFKAKNFIRGFLAYITTFFQLSCENIFILLYSFTNRALLSSSDKRYLHIAPL